MSKNTEIFHKKRIKVGDYTFLFKEADAQSYVYALKDGDEYEFIMVVTAFDQNDQPVAHYERAWETVNASTAQIFIDKFCQDAKFRAKFQYDGDAVEAVLEKPDTLVHPKCAKMIARLNGKSGEETRFRDFASLKTFGTDKVSRMKLEKLKDLVSEEQLDELTHEFGDNTIKILRWIKRGLRYDHAIHKVRVDMEISQNANR